MYFCSRIAFVLRLGIRRDDVAFVAHAMAERREPLANAGDADRRGAHVHAAPSAAQIERHADDVDVAHEAGATCYRFL